VQLAWPARVSAEARAVIQAASDALEATYRRGDAEALARMMTEDVVVSAIGFADLVGRQAIHTLFSGAFRTMRVSKYRLIVAEVEIYGDVAYDRGEFDWESSTHDGAKQTTHGRYHAVRHRGTDGVWRVHRLIENEVPPRAD
jgi:uncharacterized protein (TIGR02246 family)